MEINKLLDDCKAILGIDSDYKLAKFTGINDGRISDYRKGNRIPDAFACFKIAEILGLEEKCLIAHFEGLSAKNEKTRDYWTKKVAELGGVAASIFFAVNLIMTPTPSEAAPVLNQDSGVCILCKIVDVPKKAGRSG